MQQNHRNRYHQTQYGGHQRLRNTAGHQLRIARAVERDYLEGFDHTRHRSEQPCERCNNRNHLHKQNSALDFWHFLEHCFVQLELQCFGIHRFVARVSLQDAAKRVVIREVPSPATRRALVERGDVQVAFNIPDKDAAELAGTLDVFSTPVENCIHCLCPNFSFEPFQDPDVRKAIAYAVPYEDIFQAAAFGRGLPLYGGSEEITDTAWPRKTQYYTDLEKAKEHMAKSGYADGFDVPLSISIDLASWMEPTALLVQEALGEIGINVTIEKIPGANWRTAVLVEKRLPLHLENFGGWLNTPDYYFFWAYKDGHLFNSSNYRNEEIEALVDATLHMPMDDPEYAPQIKRMFEIALDELPRIPLYQPALNVATNGAEGYEFWFHRQLDARVLKAV